MKTILVSCLASLALVPAAAFAAAAAKPNFDAAQREANALVEKQAKAERDSRQKAQEAFIFGLREGGSTFGYGQTPLKVKGSSAIDEAVMKEARAKLRAAMPEKPTEADQVRLEIAELGLAVRGGDGRARAAALKPLMARPTNRAAANAVMHHFKSRRADTEILAFADKVLAANQGNSEMTVFGLGWRWYAAYRLSDRKIFNETKAKIEALPVSDETVGPYMTLLDYPGSWNPKDYEHLEKNLYKLKNRGIASHFYHTLLEGNQHCDDRQLILRLTEQAARYGSAKRAYATGADALMRQRCWKDAARFAEEALRLDPSAANQLRVARARLGAGPRASAAEPAKALAANAKARPTERFTGRVLELLATAKEPREVTAAVLALAKDAGAKDGTEYASWLLEAESRAFEPLMTSEGTKWLLALREALFALSHEEERVVHTVRYCASAPRTAYGAEAAGLFNGRISPVEKRFAPYGTYAWNSRAAVLNNLKCKPKPDLVGVKGEGRSAELIAVYDETGVHVYTRFRDPSAKKYARGEAKGCGYEFSVQADEARGWSQVFTSTDAVKDLYEVAWDSLAFGHHPYANEIVTDSTTTDDAFLFHTFIPWTHVYLDLPKDGDTWNTVMCASMPAGTFVLGGGAVHELGRGMRLKFAMSAAESRLVRRALVRRAAGNFIRFCRTWENVDMWEDRILGDPKFFDETVKAWRDERMASALALMRREDKDVPDAESDALAAKYLKDWLDPRLTLDAMRTASLRKKFFD